MKIKKVLAVGIFGIGFLGMFHSTKVNSEEIDVEQEFRTIANKAEVYKVNQLYGTDFKYVNSEAEYVRLDDGQHFQKIAKGKYRGRTLIRPAYSMYRFNGNEPFKIKDMTAELASYTEKDAGNVYAGTNVLDNTKSSVDQSLSTVEFTLQQSDTVSNSTTIGMKLGTSHKVEANFLFAKAEASISTEFSINNTGTKTQSHSRTYKAPSQSIKVPAGKKYRVRAILNRVRGNGEVNLYTVLDNPRMLIMDENSLSNDFLGLLGLGGGSYKPVSETYQFAVQNNIIVPSPYFESQIRDFRLKGKGTLSVEHGTNFMLIVEDMTTQSTRNTNQNARNIQPNVVKTVNVEAKVSMN